MKKVMDIYSLWYKLFSTILVPQLMDREKWTTEGENLKVNTIVYFKLLDSVLGATWRVGKIEHLKQGRDGAVRIVGIAYVGSRGESRLVERSVRDVICLFHIDDTSLMDHIREVHELAQQSLVASKDDLQNSKNIQVSLLYKQDGEQQGPEEDWYEGDLDYVEALCTDLDSHEDLIFL